MTTRVWRMVCTIVALLTLTMAVGLASPAGAQDTDPKDDCKQGGWETLTTAEGEAFDNQGNCVSYVAADGGVPQQPSFTPSLAIVDPGDCQLSVSGSGYAQFEYYAIGLYLDEPSWTATGS